MGPDANKPINFNITCSHSHTRKRTRAATRTRHACTHANTAIHKVMYQGTDTRRHITCACASLDAFSRD